MPFLGRSGLLASLLHGGSSSKPWSCISSKCWWKRTKRGILKIMNSDKRDLLEICLRRIDAFPRLVRDIDDLKGNY